MEKANSLIEAEDDNTEPLTGSGIAALPEAVCQDHALGQAHEPEHPRKLRAIPVVAWQQRASTRRA